MATTKRTCSIDGCGKSNIAARGLCRTHYSRWHDENYSECSIDGCRRGVHARGWCNKHYRRFKKSGDPLTAKAYVDLSERFSANSEYQGECLVWTGVKNQSGYGRTKIGDNHVSVHRYAYEQEHGLIPPGMQIDHICWNRACIRVEHLRLATREENKRYASGARVDNRLSIRNIMAEGDGFRVRVHKGQQKLSRHFKNLDDAIEWAAEKRRELFGEFAGRG